MNSLSVSGMNENVQLCSRGFKLLSEKPSFQLDPVWHECFLLLQQFFTSKFKILLSFKFYNKNRDKSRAIEAETWTTLGVFLCEIYKDCKLNKPPNYNAIITFDTESLMKFKQPTTSSVAIISSRLVPSGSDKPKTRCSESHSASSTSF